MKLCCWRTCRSRLRAFTLIELLVVIAVIGILAALLLSALSGAKKEAQLTYCRNNLRQMAIGLEMYVEDFNAYPYYTYIATIDPNSSPQTQYYWDHWESVLLPYWDRQNGLLVPNGANFWGGTTAWAGGVKPQITNLVFNCPGYKGNPLGVPSQAEDMLWAWSYAYNVVGVNESTKFPDPTHPFLGLSSTGLYQPEPGDVDAPPVRATRIVAPGEMFAMMDAQEGFLSPTGLDASDFVGCNYYNPFTGWANPDVTINTLQHGKLINVVYCDAHAASLKLAEVFNPTNSAAHWNIDNKAHPELWLYPLKADMGFSIGGSW
jgi:prepilin-type N-terminal cleavage/methylation domain-containing protein/prepilin-type processing-associated H-X9-DG protein